MSAPRFDPELVLDLSLDEILEDLCWPHPPPGRWALHSANGRPTVSAPSKRASAPHRRIEHLAEEAAQRGGGHDVEDVSVCGMN
jgi:hypothetical protein